MSLEGGQGNKYKEDRKSVAGGERKTERYFKKERQTEGGEKNRERVRERESVFG